MTDFLMPSLGADMERGTLVEWRMHPGEAVKRGDVVALVETEKGLIEIEIWMDGTVDRLLVSEGETVPVGAVLATIHGGEAPAVPRGIAPPPRVIERAPAAPPARVLEPVAAGPEARRRISPAARRRALDLGVDLAAVTGTGEGGAVTSADVERAAAALQAAATPPPSASDRQAAMRRAIAAAMARSKREIPHYYLEHQVDIGTCEAWLARTNAERPPDQRLLMAALTLKAIALAARRFPAFNGFYREGRFEPSSGIHAGVAIAIRGGGLAAPAIHDADQLTLDELMLRLRDLVQRMRAGRVRGSEIADATITMSSLGERGVEALYGVIHPPQVAIVGVGTTVVRPWVIGGAIEPRPIVTITLAADHRVSNGHGGALFLAEIGRQLQEPEKL